MADRYYVDFPIDAPEISVSGDVARHLLQVMRKRVGDPVTLFDGSGNEFRGRIRSVGKRSLVVEIEQTLAVDREQPIAIHIATAVPKGDRQRFLVEKLVELGAASLTPLATARSVVRLSDKQCKKLHRWVIEASQQCGRNRLMEIRQPIGFDELIETASGNPSAPSVPYRLLADPDGLPIESVVMDSRERESKESIESQEGSNERSLDKTVFEVSIGPEGGWTDAERERAIANHWHPVSLGPTVLRIETAAIAATTLLSRFPAKS